MIYFIAIGLAKVVMCLLVRRKQTIQMKWKVTTTTNNNSYETHMWANKPSDTVNNREKKKKISRQTKRNTVITKSLKRIPFWNILNNKQQQFLWIHIEIVGHCIRGWRKRILLIAFQVEFNLEWGVNGMISAGRIQHICSANQEREKKNAWIKDLFKYEQRTWYKCM